MFATFRGEGHHKVDSKGRVSIPANFRRVIEQGDPDWQPGKPPTFVLVYGGNTRDFLECFTMEAMAAVDAKIQKMPRNSKQRLALQKLYSGQAQEATVDDTGRIVLPKKARDKIGLTDTAYFIAWGDTFRIWRPETYETECGLPEADDDFDPDVDPAEYLDGDWG